MTQLRGFSSEESTTLEEDAGFVPSPRRCSSHMLAQEAPGATGLARSTRRATWIRLQDYGGKNPARLHRAPRARRRPCTARLWLRVNKPARRLGVRRSEGRGGFTLSCPPLLLSPSRSPAHSQNPTQALRAS